MKQINFNTGLIAILIGLLGWLGNKAFEKMDANNTELIRVRQSQEFVVQRLSGLEKQVSETVLRRDFETEISRLNRELDEMKRRAVTTRQ